MENFNQLIPIDEGKGKKRTMTSLQIAEITGKTHWKIQCKLPPKTKRFCPLVLK